MGIGTRVLGGLKALFVPGDNGPAIADKVDSIVKRYAPGMEGKHEMVMELTDAAAEAQANARQHDQPQKSGVPIIDAVVNGVNRLIRPTITFGLIGGLLGWWELPPPESFPEQYWSLLEIVLLFWFGGRAIFSDLPKGIAYLQALKLKRK